MSLDSGLTGPVEAPAAPAVTRSAATAERARPRRRAAPADALADAVSTPSFRSGSTRRPRRRGRRVTRIVRRIELWSVLKIALVFNTIMLAVCLGAVAVLWGLANTTGLIDDLEGFLQDAGFEDFRFDGEQMFQQVAFIGAVGVLATTVFMVLSAALLNLISEVTGGIRFVVIEEIVDEPARPGPSALPLPVVPSAPPAAPPAPGGPGGPRPASAGRPAGFGGAALAKAPSDDRGAGARADDDATVVAPVPAADDRPSAPAGGPPRRRSNGSAAGLRKRVSPAKGTRPRAGGGGGPAGPVPADGDAEA